MRAWLVSLAWSAALLAAPAAPAQAPSPLDELNRIEGSLPRSVQAVVTVRNASAARRMPAARSLEAMLRESGRLAQTERAWRSLADHLGWTPQQAFDELLGRHVTLVSGGLQGPGADDWALIGEVSRETEARLRLGLRPAPRAVVRGLTVLMIEDGAFEVTIRNRPVGAVLSGEDDDTAGPASSFMLAPAGSTHLLEEIIPLSGASGSRPAPERPLVANRTGRTTAFAMVRQGDAEDERSRVLAMTAALDPSASQPGFHVRLLLSGAAAPVQPLPAWTDAAARQLEARSLLATIGVAGLSPLQEIGEMLGLPGVAPPTGSLGPMPGRRVALIVREHETAPRLPAEGDDPVVADGARGMPRPGSVAPGLARTRAPLTITLAVEVSDLRRTIPQTDALAAAFQPLVPEDQQVGLDPLPVIDTGAPDLAIRSAPLQGDTAESWSPVLGPEPVIRWGYARSAARADPGPPSPDPGWWVIGLESEADGAGARTVEQVRSALSLDRPDTGGRPRVSVGSVRPREVERWLSAMDPTLAPLAGPLRWVDSARWDAWVNAYGAVEGEITIRMHPPAER